MDKRYTHSVLVTGASGDIGNFIANRFLEKGYFVAGIDLKDPKTHRVSDAYCFTKCNLSDFKQTQDTLDALVKDHGVFDVIVNTAGTIANAPVLSFTSGKMDIHDPALWDLIIQSNLYTAFYTSAICAKHLISTRRKGVIINISSISAKGNIGQAAYSAAKAGINGLTVSLAKELGPFGVRAVAIAPGFFDTPSTRAHVNEQKIKGLTAATPLKRLGDLAELQRTIEYVIETDFLNGKIIELDGGLTL